MGNYPPAKGRVCNTAPLTEFRRRRTCRRSKQGGCERPAIPLGLVFGTQPGRSRKTSSSDAEYSTLSNVGLPGHCPPPEHVTIQFIWRLSRGMRECEIPHLGSSRRLPLSARLCRSEMGALQALSCRPTADYHHPASPGQTMALRAMTLLALVGLMTVAFNSHPIRTTTAAYRGGASPCREKPKDGG